MFLYSTYARSGRTLLAYHPETLKIYIF